MRRSAAHDAHASHALTRRPRSAQGRNPKSTQVRPKSAQRGKVNSAQVRPDIVDGMMRPARKSAGRSRKSKSAKMKVDATIDLKQLEADLPEFAKQLALLTAEVYEPTANVEQELEHDAKAHDANAAVMPVQLKPSMLSNGANVHSATSQKGGRLSRTQRFENESSTAARARARLEKQERIAFELGLLNILPDYDAAAAARAAKKSIAERQVFTEEWDKIVQDRELEFILRNSPQIDGEPEPIDGEPGPIDGEPEPASGEANPMPGAIAEIEV